MARSDGIKQLEDLSEEINGADPEETPITYDDLASWYNRIQEAIGALEETDPVEDLKEEWEASDQYSCAELLEGVLKWAVGALEEQHSKLHAVWIRRALESRALTEYGVRELLEGRKELLCAEVCYPVFDGRRSK